MDTITDLNQEMLTFMRTKDEKKKEELKKKLLEETVPSKYKFSRKEHPLMKMAGCTTENLRGQIYPSIYQLRGCCL